MNNYKIRIAMMKNNVRQWEVAKLLGLSEATLSRKMREELPEEVQGEIVQKIESAREGVLNE